MDYYYYYFQTTIVNKRTYKTLNECTYEPVFRVTIIEWMGICRKCVPWHQVEAGYAPGLESMKYNASILGENSNIIREASSIFQLQLARSQGLTCLEFQITSIELNNAQHRISGQLMQLMVWTLIVDLNFKILQMWVLLSNMRHGQSSSAVGIGRFKLKLKKIDIL